MGFSKIFGRTTKMATIAALASLSMLDPSNTDEITVDESVGYGPFNQYKVSNNSDVLIQIKLNGNPLNAIEIEPGTFTSFVVEREDELTKNLFFDMIVDNLDAVTATGASNVIVELSKVV